jgi:hypothetical protein
MTILGALDSGDRKSCIASNRPKSASQILEKIRIRMPSKAVMATSSPPTASSSLPLRAGVECVARSALSFGGFRVRIPCGLCIEAQRRHLLGIVDGGKLVLIVDQTPLSQAEAYGQALPHPRGHMEVWEAWQRLGPTGLARRGLPTAIAFSEYDDHPQGRIVYDNNGTALATSSAASISVACERWA